MPQDHSEQPPHDLGAGANQPARTPAGSPSSHDAYRELFESSTDAMTMIVGERFVDCNAAAVKMLGVSSRELVLSMHPSEISPPKQPDGRDSYEKANEMIAIAFERGSHRFEWDHMRADGTPFPVEVLLTVLHVGGQNLLHAVWRDLAERKALEEQLRHAQKMEALGKLAGGIAHDFNNLLVVVQGHADLLGRRISGDPASLKHLDRIKEAGDRAAALVQQLLAFGRKQEILPRVLDVNQVVLGTTSLLKPLLSDNVELQVVPAGKPILVKADQGQLEQVLLNLAANARDAMPDGGRLTITITTRKLAAPSVDTTKPLEPGSYAVITVTDTGVGMSEQTIERAFDPFFTTKGLGKGTGLGLATVYGIVTQNGGGVSLSSTPGPGPDSGTTISIHLPISTESVSPQRVPASEQADPGGSETILVAEDEPVVSELIVQVLEAHGYTVLLARDGAQAADLYREHNDSVALILTDVMMPRLSGIDMVKDLAREGHEPPVLFMSGYTNNALPQLSRLDGYVDMIKKPFDLNELARRVRIALDRARNDAGKPRNGG